MGIIFIPGHFDATIVKNNKLLKYYTSICNSKQLYIELTKK